MVSPRIIVNGGVTEDIGKSLSKLLKDPKAQTTCKSIMADGFVKFVVALLLPEFRIRIRDAELF
jgi:hypothetical protein